MGYTYGCLLMSLRGGDGEFFIRHRKFRTCGGSGRGLRGRYFGGCRSLWNGRA